MPNVRCDDDPRALQTLVEALDHIAAEQGWDGEGMLVRAEEQSLGVNMLEGRHPRELLLGSTAPPEWLALGLLHWGWAGPLGGGRPSRHPSRVRSRTIMAVDRAGHVISRTHLADGRQIDDLPEGVLIDALRRVFGLSTPPPAGTTVTLFAALWLADIGAVARRTASRLSWPAIARLHPASKILAEADPAIGKDHTILIPAARVLAQVYDWDRVRQECIDRAWLSDVLAPKLAAWMDAGMVSRWLLDSVGPVGDLLADVVARVDPAVARRVRRTLTELEVDADAGPQRRDQ